MKAPLMGGGVPSIGSVPGAEESLSSPPSSPLLGGGVPSIGSVPDAEESLCSSLGNTVLEARQKHCVFCSAPTGSGKSECIAYFPVKPRDICLVIAPTKASDLSLSLSTPPLTAPPLTAPPPHAHLVLSPAHLHLRILISHQKRLPANKSAYLGELVSAEDRPLLESDVWSGRYQWILLSATKAANMLRGLPSLLRPLF